MSDLQDTIIPSDPAVLQKIGMGIREVLASKVRAKAETDLQTEIFQNLSEETGVPNNMLRKLASAEAEIGGIDKLQKVVDDVVALKVSVDSAMRRVLTPITTQQKVDDDE